MLGSQDLRKAQLKMLEILTVIDEICVKHNIQYWLACGTLLGAARHKGFIPWDDDCDISMMREDYEMFLKVAQNELPDNLFIQNHVTDPHYPRSMTKIRMKNTKLVEFDESENEKYHQGIFVDIFVMDYYSSFEKSFLKSISIILDWKYKRKAYPRGSWQRTAIQIGVALPYFLFSTTIKFMRAISPLHRKHKSRYVCVELNGCDYIFLRYEDVFPCKCSAVFEGKYFSVPHNTDAVLKEHYGDYMQIPPPEQRYWHAKAIEC